MNTGAARTLQRRCAGIELLIVDVDGVLTDGGIIHGTGGLELKRFHVRDGFGLRAWQEAGKRTAIVTGRSTPVVEVRAREVGIELVFSGVADKMQAFRRVLEQTGLSVEAACYVGDDLPDLAPLRQCGLAVAVADARPELRAVAHYITRTPGGGGAAREVIELVLHCQGRWPQPVPLAPAAGERGRGSGG